MDSLVNSVLQYEDFYCKALQKEDTDRFDRFPHRTPFTLLDSVRKSHLKATTSHFHCFFPVSITDPSQNSIKKTISNSKRTTFLSFFQFLWKNVLDWLVDWLIGWCIWFFCELEKYEKRKFKSVHGFFLGRCKNYVRIFVELAESLTDKEEGSPEDIFVYPRLLELLLVCCNHPDYEVSICFESSWSVVSHIACRDVCCHSDCRNGGGLLAVALWIGDREQWGHLGRDAKLLWAFSGGRLEKLPLRSRRGK